VEPLAVVRRRFEFLVRLFEQEFVFHPDLPPARLLADAGRLLAGEGIVSIAFSGAVTSPGGLAPVLVDATPKPSDELEADELWDLSLDPVADDVVVSVAAADKARLLVAAIRNFFEAYYVVLEGATVLARKGPLTEKELVQALLVAGQRMFLTADVTRPEAVGKQNVTNAVRHFRARRVLVPDPQDPERLSLDPEAHEEYLRPLRRLFVSRALRDGVTPTAS